MALIKRNQTLFTGQDGTYTSAVIDVKDLKFFALFITFTEGGSGTAKLQASILETGTFSDVTDSSQNLGTGAGSAGWDVTSQFPFYKIVITSGGSTAGSSGYIVSKAGLGD